MKKHNLLRATALVLTAVLSVLAVIPLQHAETDRSDWMAELDDSLPLNALFLPGTHDSGALHSIADVSGKCQTLTVSDQLEIGVRFLDIRLQLVNDELKIVHSFVDQQTDFSDIMDDMAAFLRENPSEFLLVSFKEDADPKRSEADFSATLEAALHAYPDIVSESNALPVTVGEARGKLHVIARYADATLGLPCHSGWVDDDSFPLNGLYVQDNYRVDSAEEKFSEIVTAYEIACASEYTLVLNYTSCYLTKGFPPLYAGTPAHDIHFGLRESIPLIGGPLGVLVCDFMTSDLAELIIRRNFR